MILHHDPDRFPTTEYNMFKTQTENIDGRSGGVLNPWRIKYEIDNTVDRYFDILVSTFRTVWWLPNMQHQ